MTAQTDAERPSPRDYASALEDLEWLDMWAIRACAAELRHLAAEVEALRAANVKLVGAIDLIRETLSGGNVDDLAFIINQALDAAKEPK